jgi:hypothetical protein
VDSAEVYQKIAFQNRKCLPINGKKCQKTLDILPSTESHLRPLLTSLKTDHERIAVWQNGPRKTDNEQTRQTNY